MTSKHDKSENELRHFFSFFPAVPGLLMWLIRFPFLLVWSSRRERSFPSSGRSTSQARCGQGRLSCWGVAAVAWRFPKEPMGTQGSHWPSQTSWFTGWSAGVDLEAQSGFNQRADGAVMDPPGWVLSWSLLWLSGISYGNCVSCACLAYGLGQMSKWESWFSIPVWPSVFALKLV